MQKDRPSATGSIRKSWFFPWQNYNLVFETNRRKQIRYRYDRISKQNQKRGCLTSLDGPLKFFLVPKSIKWIVLITNKVQIFCRIRDDFLYLKNERYAVRAVYLSRDQLNIRITIDKQSRCVHIVRGPWPEWLLHLVDWSLLIVKVPRTYFESA